MNNTDARECCKLLTELLPKYGHVAVTVIGELMVHNADKVCIWEVQANSGEFGVYVLACYEHEAQAVIGVKDGKYSIICLSHNSKVVV